jgi:LPS-assembly protein
MGVPVLPIPSISFPLSDKRKSGFLPPTIGLDSLNGVELSSRITGTSRPTATRRSFPPS